MKIEGQLSWVDFHSNDAEKTADFLKKTLGIKIISETKDEKINYKVIMAEKGILPFGGIMQINNESEIRNNSTLAYLTVLDYDSVSDNFIKNGAKEIGQGASYVDGMKFGMFLIPGNVAIALAQYMK
ncbi:MAG: hypothetical protein LBC92_01375 [Rickettsiales bacterium]|jgi:predicted enzyme related to lactoylglutathione lyase|nr:hypothetical protein [Rickettsiales bacterium]